MNGPGLVVTAEEWHELYGLPPLAIVLYLAISRRRDFKTGRVGIKPSVSWQAFREDLYVEPHSGIKGGSPSKNALRRAAAWLVRAKLVVMQSNEAQRHLIFLLPLARRDSLVSNKPGTNPDHHPGPQATEEKSTATRTTRQARTRHTPVISNSNHHHHIDTAGSGVKWSDSLGESERQLLTKMLTSARVNGQAQILADELTAAIEKGAIRKGAVAWFSGVLNRWKDGTFQQTPEGASISRRRSPVKRSEPPPPPTDPRASSASARAHIEAMREKLRSGKR